MVAMHPYHALWGLGIMGGGPQESGVVAAWLLDSCPGSACRPSCPVYSGYASGDLLCQSEQNSGSDTYAQTS